MQRIPYSWRFVSQRGPWFSENCSSRATVKENCASKFCCFYAIVTRVYISKMPSKPFVRKLCPALSSGFCPTSRRPDLVAPETAGSSTRSDATTHKARRILQQPPRHATVCLLYGLKCKRDCCVVFAADNRTVHAQLIRSEQSIDARYILKWCMTSRRRLR